MSIPKEPPDFDNTVSRIWFDYMIEAESKGNTNKIKIENGKFYWYSKMSNTWFEFHKWLDASQEEIMAAYDKWLNKKILE